MEAGKRNIAAIFNRTGILKIPHFQRAYVWEEDQWERFLEDLSYVSRTNSEYFMGSVILKQQETTSQSQTRDIRTVIDGQQRLTTIMLFLKALYQKLEQSNNFSNIFKTFNDEIILEHNYLDKPVFEKILLDKELTKQEKENLISKCYEFFVKNLNNEINPNNILQNVLFIGIDLANSEDEQQIFDTINSLGVSLTTAELLKNYLFKDDIESYKENWRDVFEKNDETRNYWEQEVTSGRQKRDNIDLFLQSYLFIKIQEKTLKVTSDYKEKFSRIDSIFNSYKQFIKNYNLDKNGLIRELKEYATVYKKIVDPVVSEKDIEKNNYMQRLNLLIFSLGITTVIPYMLYVFKKVQDESEKSKIFGYLETYFMRRIICRATTKNYNQLFGISLINNEIDSFSKLQEFIENKSDGIDHMPTDKDVETGFKESILPNLQALSILYLMEKTIRSDLNSTELKPFDEYSLEHLMPKNWRNNWDQGGKLSDLQGKERDRILATLGNLTLLTRKLNSSIRDSDWTSKKIGSGKNKGLDEYAQGIEIFSKNLQKDTWNEDDIKERADELYKYAILKVWNLC